MNNARPVSIRLSTAIVAGAGLLASSHALACNSGGEPDMGGLLIFLASPVGFLFGIATVVLFTLQYTVPSRGLATGLLVVALISLGFGCICLAAGDLFHGCGGDPNSGNCAFGWIAVTQVLVSFIAVLLALHHKPQPATAEPASLTEYDTLADAGYLL